MAGAAAGPRRPDQPACSSRGPPRRAPGARRPRRRTNRRAGGVTAAAGLALAAAVERVAGFEPALKWPNDLVVTGDDDLKLAGLLADAEVAGGELRALVIGVGCNVRWPDPATSAFPKDLRGTATA